MLTESVDPPLAGNGLSEYQLIALSYALGAQDGRGNGFTIR